MPVPLFSLTEQHSALREELRATFDRVLDSGRYILGGEVDALEAECATYLGCKHAIAVSSGTDALVLALMALNIQPGDEVLVPSFTFFASAGSVARLGAIPVFVDSCPLCFNMDVGDTERKITPRTKAIMPVHLFGQAAEMTPLMALAKAHNLHVVEDAAQAFGASYKGRKLGTIGHFGCFSFFPTKNLGALGDAGLLTTNDDALAHRARILRVHGMEPKYHHQLIGANFRIDALQAALLRVKLPLLDSWAAARQRNAERYRELLAPLASPPATQACTQSTNCTCKDTQSPPHLILPCLKPDRTHIWNQFTIRLTAPGLRDSLKAHLDRLHIGNEIYYPIPLHAQHCFAHLPTNLSSLPNATTLAQQVLSLPIYPELSPTQIEEVANAVKEFLHK